MNKTKAATLASAVAATLGSSSNADAATYVATLLEDISYAGAGSSSAALGSSTATWSYDDVTNMLTQTGGTFNARFTIVPSTTLFRHSIQGLVIGNGAAAAATSFTCTEGNFGGNVGASLCGNYNFGANFANESSTSWGPGAGFARTIGGDDMAIGSQQNLASGYDGFTLVSWVGTTLILANRACNPLAPGNTNGCATLGGFNQGYLWTLQAGPQTGVVPTAVDDTATTRLNVATTPIAVLANDTGGFATGTVMVDVGAPDAGGTVAITDSGVPCAAPCSVADASTLRVILTPSAPPPTPTYTETFTYTVTKGVDTDTATVSVTVNNGVPNDQFAYPIVLSGSTTVGGSNIGATGEPGEPDHALVSFPLNSAWWSWSSSVAGEITISTEGSDFDTALAVYVGETVASLTEVTSNDDFGDLTSQVTFSVSPGTPYAIAVDGFEGIEGNINLVIAFVPVPTDSDGDGFLDMADNCRAVPNASQCDSDNDGYGNRCDGDFGPGTGDGVTNAKDYTLFRQQLGQPSIAPTYNKADINCDGFVNASDTTLFKRLLGSPPGPGAGP